MKALLLLLYMLHTLNAQRFEDYDDIENYRVKLTAEHQGPPPGAQYVPIPVVSNIPDPSSRKPTRPLKGRPPPPPPVVTPKPTRRPKPTTFGPIAPPPLPVPPLVPQRLPMGPGEPSGLPPLPPNLNMVTPPQEVRPDLETVPTTPKPPPTTTPNTNDAAPAVYHRFEQNDDGSYFFDFESINNIKRFEQGFFKHDNLHENPILVKTGMYSFISPEGIPFRTDYVADERGYRSFRRFDVQTANQLLNV